jgi:glycosyltransferase involved in cell wall biosynthesis
MSDLVSVIMPVYNAEKYLAKAISSLLHQTFKDFELIIINDGSTDKSLDIINSFNDPRIKLLSRKNRGIVDSLNEALEIVKGKYIARMDSDDICELNRFEKQYSYLEDHAKTGLVVSTVDLIDEKDELLNIVWPQDREAITEKQIRENMPKNNCIAHPAIMVRANIIKKYKYHNQKNGEDYDLWLRMLSDGIRIHKINEPLLKYRLHAQSLTQTSADGGGFVKLISIKKGFLRNQIKAGKWGKIEKEVLISLGSDYTNYYADHSNKKYAKYPFKILRRAARLYGKTKKLAPYLSEKKMLEDMVPSSLLKNNKKNMLFILPWMTTGGADKVALDIVTELKDKYNWHFILTDKGQPNNWISLFSEVSKNILNISDIKFGKNKSTFIYRYCVKNNIDEVIISNSISGYRSLHLVKRKIKSIKVFDILHGEGGKLEGGGYPKIMQPYDKYINLHITVTDYLKNLLVKKYNNNPKKIKAIHNGIDVSAFNENKKVKNKKIAWVGRMSPEKHPEIILKIAKAMPEYDFKVIGGGDMLEEVLSVSRDINLKNIDIVGEKNNINKELSECSILIMTSEIEGFPIALLEAGAKGLPVIAPNVGGISEYVMPGKNGYMVRQYDRIEEYVSEINKIAKNKIWPKDKIRSNVVEKFSLSEVLRAYEEILK